MIENNRSEASLLLDLLREAADALRSMQDPSTHYDGCEASHYTCGLLARIKAELGAIPTSGDSQAGGDTGATVQPPRNESAIALLKGWLADRSDEAEQRESLARWLADRAANQPEACAIVEWQAYFNALKEIANDGGDDARRLKFMAVDALTHGERNAEPQTGSEP
jgi:hypothetical protein